MTPKGLRQLEGNVPLGTSIGAVDQLKHIKLYLSRCDFSGHDPGRGGASFSQPETHERGKRLSGLALNLDGNNTRSGGYAFGLEHFVFRFQIVEL